MPLFVVPPLMCVSEGSEESAFKPRIVTLPPCSDVPERASKTLFDGIKE